MRLGLVAVLVLLVATPALARSDPQTAAGITQLKGNFITLLKGNFTFPATDSRTSCSFRPKGATKVEEHCIAGGFGTFAGVPGRAGASIGWTWLLELKNGKPTGFGTEKTILKLNFGGGRTLELACTGKVKPVGPQGTNGKTKTTGTCKVKKSAGFARTLGAATGTLPLIAYTFTAAHVGALYKLLKGTLDGKGIPVNT